MRILFCSTGGMGHIQPLRTLAGALLRQGHAVGWVTAPDALATFDGQGITVFAAGMGFEASRRQFDKCHPEMKSLAGQCRSDQTFPRLFGATLAPAMLAGVIDAIDRWQPDLVVHEPAALAAPLACELRRIRCVTHAYGLPVPRAYLEAAMRWFGASWSASGLAAPSDGGLYRHLSVDIAPASLLGDLSTPPARRLALNSYAVRADEALALPEDLRTVLSNTTRPRVYLTFGTVFNREPVLVDAAHALIALGAEVVVTVGLDGDAGRFGPSVPHLHVHRFVEQAALLAHCDAVVSHGGAGSVLGAAAHGLPQLVLPQGADHFRNGRAVAAASAGILLNPPLQTGDGIRAAAGRLLERNVYAGAARRLASEMAAMSSADEVARALVRYC